MPSIFLLGSCIQSCVLPVKLPKQFRGKKSSKAAQKQSKLVASKDHTKDHSAVKGEEKLMTTVLSGNLTDSTESLFSRSSCGSTMTMDAPLFSRSSCGSMEDPPPLQKATRVVSSEDNLEANAVEIMPAKSFYFMPIEEEFSDLQSTTSDSDWGYFVDFAG